MTEADIRAVFDYYTAYEDAIEKVKIVTIADIRERTTLCNQPYRKRRNKKRSSEETADSFSR